MCEINMASYSCACTLRDGPSLLRKEKCEKEKKSSTGFIAKLHVSDKPICKNASYHWLGENHLFLALIKGIRIDKLT